MIGQATSLHRIAAARGKARSTQARGPVFALLVVVLAALLAGCASGPEVCLTRTEIRRVPQPVFIDLPPRFIEPLEIPALEPPLDNQALEADTQALEDVIDRANSDRAEIRRAQQQRKEQNGND